LKSTVPPTETKAGKNTAEAFAIPCVGAIICGQKDGQDALLIQERQKQGGGIENGMLEVAAGKVREYENVFDALRREVKEETGLSISRIGGEESSTVRTVNGYEVMSFTPFLTTQNLSGGYSIILHTFICEAEGMLLEATGETTNIRWITHQDCRELLRRTPEAFYPLHINALSLFLGVE
jgi:8-oxo-dGTP pyrophosphatase MutT (NUDIX family)